MIKITTHKYSLPCTKRAFAFFKNAERKGLFFSIHDGQRLGIAEYAPMPLFHRASVKEMSLALSQLDTIKLEPLFMIEPLYQEKLKEFLFSFSPMLRPVLSNVHWHYFQEPFLDNSLIQLAALIGPSPLEEAITTAQRFLAQGFISLKLKVGSLPIEEEVEKINTIAKLGGSKLMLRLDANQRLSFPHAIALIRGLKNVTIEYFEEPLADPKGMQNFYEKTGIPLAIDEYLQSKELQTLPPAIKYIVIKPSRFPSFYEVEQLVKKAVILGKIPILSHCFESDFSASIFAVLVDKLGLHDQAHGIFAEGFFKQNSMRSYEGCLRLKDCLKVLNPDKVFLW